MKQIHEWINSMAFKTQDIRIRRILIACVLIAQVALVAFWTSQRSNYYIDELFSFGSAHSFTFNKKDVMYINRSAEWQYEIWVDNAVLKNQLEVTSNESLFSQPPLKGLRMLLTGRNYHGILNLLMSLFSPGKVSMFPAIVFNVILFVLAQLVLYRIMKELTGSFAISCLTLIMYGFSAMAISTVLYIRFYMLVTLLLLLLIRLHQIMWRHEDLVQCELLILFCMVLIYFAMKDSEMVFIIAGTLVTAYAVGLMITKQFKKAGLYIVTVFPVSLIYAVTKTNFIDIAFNLEKYSKGDVAEAWMTSKLLTVNKDRVISLVFKYLGWISDLLFGSWYALCSFGILILILLEIRMLGKKQVATVREEKKKDGFIWVIAAVCLVYYIFALLTAIPAERYFMFYFPMLAILFWKALHELSKDIVYRSEVLMICLALTVFGAVSLQCLRYEKIDFVYVEDRPLIQAVQESGIDHAIVIYTDERDSNHSAYECLNLMPENAKLYPMRTEKNHIDVQECPDEVLVWIHYDRSPDQYISELLDDGYELEELGGTHASDVYIARHSAY